MKWKFKYQRVWLNMKVLLSISVFLICLVSFGNGLIEPTEEQYRCDKGKLKKICYLRKVSATDDTLNVIINAAYKYQVSAVELASIAVVETALGNLNRVNINKNKTHDVGLFQINSVNFNYCREYDVRTDSGSAMCAAKILSKIKMKHPNDYLGRYHSNTSFLKKKYERKVKRVYKSI